MAKPGLSPGSPGRARPGMMGPCRAIAAAKSENAASPNAPLAGHGGWGMCCADFRAACGHWRIAGSGATVMMPWNFGPMPEMPRARSSSYRRPSVGRLPQLPRGSQVALMALWAGTGGISAEYRTDMFLLSAERTASRFTKRCRHFRYTPDKKAARRKRVAVQRTWRTPAGWMPVPTPGMVTDDLF